MCKYPYTSFFILGIATLGVTIVECVVEIVDGLLDIVALLSSYLARLRHLASKEDVNTSLRVSRILGQSPKGMWPLSTGTIISTKSILQGNFVSRHSPLGDPKV